MGKKDEQKDEKKKSLGLILLKVFLGIFIFILIISGIVIYDLKKYIKTHTWADVEIKTTERTYDPWQEIPEEHTITQTVIKEDEIILDKNHSFKVESVKHDGTVVLNVGYSYIYVIDNREKQTEEKITLKEGDEVTIYEQVTDEEYKVTIKILSVYYQ